MALRHRFGLLLLTLLMVGAAWACESNNNGAIIPGNNRPRVAFTINPADPVPGQLITVDASSSSDDGGIIRFDITLRNGSGQTVTSLTGPQDHIEFTLGAGTYSVTVLAADATGETSSQTVNFVVSDCGISPILNTVTLGDAIEGSGYSATLSVVGGVAPITFEVANGFTLPDGLTLSPTGELSGVPSLGTVGSYVLRLVVKDSCDVAPREQQVNIGLNIISNPFGCPGLSISSGPPPDGRVGNPYSFTLSAAGGNPPISWDIASGALPPGLLLIGDSLNGAPSASSVYVVGIRATDSCAPTPQSAVQSYTIRVNP